MSDAHQLVDHLFRHEAGRITAALTRGLGVREMDLAEEATQEAMIRALQTWPFRGVPPEPAAWLHRTARNYAVDQLRRRANWEAREPQVQQFLQSQPGPSAGDPIDDTLAMMLLCCHRAIPAESRVALTLKTVSGFSTREVAAAFLLSEETVAQRIVRAKRRIRESAIEWELPAGEELDRRLDTVCQVLYLLFNEGYFTSQGEQALRRDLCEEALRLLNCMLDAGHGRPERWALAGLFHLHLARFSARVDGDGQLTEFATIAAAPFDAAQLRLADAALAHAMRADELSAWHLEAAIAAAHCRAERDWAHILQLYDALLQLRPSPLIRLNRAVAQFRSGARQAALAELAALRGEESLQGYPLLPATEARLLEEAGEWVGARASYARALRCPMSAPARELLARRLAGA